MILRAVTAGLHSRSVSPTLPSMCRFLFYAGTPVLLDDLLFQPKYSLIQQSIHSREREEPLNGDGFGVAWYVPPTQAPGLFRSISPAWSNQNLQAMAKVTHSPCVLAHVRAASEGLAVFEGNCHPFTHGQLSLMHNGDLADFKLHRRRLLAELSDKAYATLQGYTDSEYLFALFLDRWWQHEGALQGTERMAAALESTIARAIELTDSPAGARSYFNIVVSDGHNAVGCRVTTDLPERAESLHVHTGSIYRVIAGVCRMVAPSDGKGAVIISSEPLSDDPAWLTVPPNHLVMVGPERKAQLRQMLA